MAYAKGWNMVAAHSDINGTNVYNIMADGSGSSGFVLHNTNQFVDADTYVICIGGRRDTPTTARDSLVGMANELRLYSDEVLPADLYTLLSNACNAPCINCPTTIAPNCLEYNNNAYIGQWDFSQATYLTNVPDTGPNGFDFVLLDDQKSYDPIYVHNQGLYFDGTSHMRTAGTWNQQTTQEVTVEAWIRPTQASLGGTLFSFEANPNNAEFSVGFNDNNFEVKLNGGSAIIPFTSYAAADVNTWQYFGVSVQKVSATQSKV